MITATAICFFQFNLFVFISHIIQKVIYNDKNDFYTISMEDVDAIKERIACDRWHPQGYKKININGNMVIKRGKMESKTIYTKSLLYT